MRSFRTFLMLALVLAMLVPTMVNAQDDAVSLTLWTFVDNARPLV